MEEVWKKQFNKRAFLDIPEYKKSFWTKEGHQQLHDVTISLVEKLRNVRTILDVGCGPGKYCKTLTDKGYDVLGVDYSENQIELAKQKYPQLRFMVANGYELPFENNSFDVSISIGALQCLVDHKKFINELIRVSSKAIILCTLLSEKKSNDPMKTLKEQLKTDSFPCREYHPSELLPIFQDAKMTISVITTFNNEKILDGYFIVARKL